jgi:hypothetical protein
VCPQDLAPRRDLKAFSHRFTGFTARDGLRHKGDKIVITQFFTTDFWSSSALFYSEAPATLKRLLAVVWSETLLKSQG